MTTRGDYHKYVFDVERRKLVGDFEGMYAAEAAEGFDSWRERDLRMLRKRLSREILDDYCFGSILDIGCGKGSFTQLLKRKNNEVVGIDGSSTAIARASESFPDIDFRQMDVREVATLGRRFDAAVMMAVLAYVETWRELLRDAASLASWLYVAEYVPDNPIGFVKSIADLVDEFQRYCEIRTKVILDDEQCLMLGEVRPPTATG